MHTDIIHTVRYTTIVYIYVEHHTMQYVYNGTHAQHVLNERAYQTVIVRHMVAAVGLPLSPAMLNFRNCSM